MTTQTIANTAAPAAKTFLGMTPAEWSDILIVVAIIGIIALAAYCGWQYWKKTKAAKAAEVTETAPATPVTTVNVSDVKVVESFEGNRYKKFALKKGEKSPVTIAVFDMDTDKLYAMKKNCDPTVDRAYDAVEKRAIPIWLDEDTFFGKIVVNGDMAEFKPATKKEE